MLPKLLISIAVVATACSSPEGKLSQTEEKGLVRALTAISSAPPDMHSVMAAMALSEIETKRLPASLIKPLGELSKVAPEMRAVIISKGISESIEILKSACKGSGLETIAMLGKSGPEKGLAIVREGCKFDRFNLVSTPAPGTDPSQYLLGHLVLSYLEDHGGASDNERALIKHLAEGQLPTAGAQR